MTDFLDGMIADIQAEEEIFSFETLESFIYKNEDDWSDMTEETHSVMRASWILDGSETLSEAIDAARSFALYLEELDNQGWQLAEAIENNTALLEYRGE